jgi:hypothetical protein
MDERLLRSQGEVQIARLLASRGICFLYEQPLAVLDEGKLRVWYPDFTLPEYGMVIEYGGKMDDPAYRAGFEHKALVYTNNGIAALMLTANDLKGRWPQRVLGGIEGILLERAARWRQAKTPRSLAAR